MLLFISKYFFFSVYFLKQGSNLLCYHSTVIKIRALDSKSTSVLAVDLIQILPIVQLRYISKRKSGISTHCIQLS